MKTKNLLKNRVLDKVMQTIMDSKVNESYINQKFCTTHPTNVACFYDINCDNYFCINCFDAYYESEHVFHPNEQILVRYQTFLVNTINEGFLKGYENISRGQLTIDLINVCREDLKKINRPDILVMKSIDEMLDLNEHNINENYHIQRFCESYLLLGYSVLRNILKIVKQHKQEIGVLNNILEKNTSIVENFNHFEIPLNASFFTNSEEYQSEDIQITPSVSFTLKIFKNLTKEATFTFQICLNIRDKSVASHAFTVFRIEKFSQFNKDHFFKSVSIISQNCLILKDSKTEIIGDLELDPSEYCKLYLYYVTPKNYQKGMLAASLI
jgi:hypothetical protein